MSIGYKNILSHIIQTTYVNEIRNRQDRKPLEMNRNGLLLEFDLRRAVCTDTLKHDPSLYDVDSYYPKYELLIHGEFASIGVYTRAYDLHGVRKRKPEGFEKCWSYHDSCWRTDGVDRVLSFLEDIVDGMWTISCDSWHTIAKLDSNTIEQLLRLRRARFERLSR